MDTSPRIYYWGFTPEELLLFDEFLQEFSPPQSLVIEPRHGHLTLHEILFSEKEDGEELVPDEKVLLFFNVPAEFIQKVMKGAKTREVPQPIYAMVTRENVAWKFSDLVDHLKKEHEFVQRRLKGNRQDT
jgi:hypothetical protein